MVEATALSVFAVLLPNSRASSAQASSIQTNEQVDEAGVRIAVGKGSAYDLYLQRTIQKAELVQAPTSPAVFSFFVEKGLEVPRA